LTITLYHAKPGGHTLTISKPQQETLSIWRGGLNHVLPPKRHIEILAPHTCECDLIWKCGLCRYNQVKMRSYWTKMNCNGWCPCKNRRI
jgi:hypothetical protein